jgi:cytidyltransferase-like protein
MRTVIVSGFFNPLHGGHLDLIEEAGALGDRLIVIVNNDVQQHLKKGKIILDEQNRLRLIKSLRQVDEAVLSLDQDPTVIQTLESIAETHPNEELIFANGGDRDSKKAVPEAAVCSQYGIQMVFDAGGTLKADSSTRINQATGHER